jgi:hypothetical protein
MNQSKLESLAEIGFNVLVGWIIGLTAQIFFFPLIGIEATFSQNFLSSVIFTVISIVRSYVIRRWFNAGIHKFVVNIVRKWYERRI